MKKLAITALLLALGIEWLSLLVIGCWMARFAVFLLRTAAALEDGESNRLLHFLCGQQSLGGLNAEVCNG